MGIPPLRPDLADGAVVRVAPEPRKVYSMKGERLARPDVGVRLRYHDCGGLELPGGRIVAGDPYSIDASIRPFRRPVPAAAHRVFSVTAETKFGRPICAFGGVVFEDRPATRYTLALREGEFVWNVPPGNKGGVGTDSATVCVVAASQARALSSAMGDYDQSQTIIEDALKAGLGGVATLSADRDEVRLGVWNSGFGDGSYTAYWGMSGLRRIVSLVIDFDVVANGLRWPAVARETVGDDLEYTVAPDVRDD